MIETIEDTITQDQLVTTKAHIMEQSKLPSVHHLEPYKKTYPKGYRF
jgi:hypothetical protein